MNEEILKNSERFIWLMEQVRMRRADSEGPSCPELHLLVDIWNEHSSIPAIDRFIHHIDEKLGEQNLKI